MRFLLALAACLLAAPTSWTLSLYGFNQVKYLENLDLKLAKSPDQQQQHEQLSPVILGKTDNLCRQKIQLFSS